MVNKDFAHLHIHNEFSFLDGYGTAEQYAEKAQQLGIKHLALTNHGNVDGCIKWQKACKAKDIHSILGCEFYIVDNMVWRPANKQEKDRRYHITLLAKDMVGWKNLLQLCTYANMQGFYYRPRIDFDLLKEHLEGLVVMTACISSFMGMGDWGVGLDMLIELRDLVKSDLYIEVMPNIHKLQVAHNKNCVQIANELKIGLVATNDCHYVNAEDAKLQEVLLCMQRKDTWKNPNRWRFDFLDLHLCSTSEMAQAFRKQGVLTEGQISAAMQATAAIANKCTLFVEQQDVVLPLIEVPQYKDLDEQDQLINLCLDGLELLAKKHEYISDSLSTYHERLQEELGLIVQLGFTRYFLIVWELISWCKANDILCGPGRGSVGGCLVAYCLGITMVDPIRHGLVFSRFISEARVDLPDIDMDFEDRKRKQIRKHLAELYGEHNVSSISTFAKMHGRGALRDIGRVFDLPMVDVDKAAKSVVVRSVGDLRESFTIKDSFDTFEDGRAFLKKYPTEAQIAMDMEGQVKNAGKHAAAMVVSANDFRSGDNSCYSYRTKELVCNWDKHDSEYMGLMKLDVLGLNALTILSEARNLIKIRHEVDIDFESISIDDEEVYAEFTKGNNVGCFQVNSLGMMRLSREIGIENFEELTALNALHRPGCLRSGMVTTYTKRKHGQEEVPKIHPFISDITKDTYGVILYQEQVMMLMYELGGLPWRTADGIRKVISKKAGEEQFLAYQKQFVEGCLEKQTLSEKEAKTVFNEVKFFGNYGFNKAHAVEYALIAYWDQWLKVHYPVEFMIACLSQGTADVKKSVWLDEARRLGMKVSLPDLNLSESSNWTADSEGNLLIPFVEIKGVGPIAAKAIVKERKTNGSFKDKEDLIKRVPKRQVNSRVVKLLEDAKAFDSSSDKTDLTENQLEELSDLFAFSLTNDPMYKFRKCRDKVATKLDISPIGSLDFSSEDNEYAYYFGKMTQVRYGYREHFKGKRQKIDKVKELKGVVGDLGGVYGNLEDDSDFVMLVFGSGIYQKRKYEIEHCDGQWMLVRANHPWKSTSVHTENLWFGDDLLKGDLYGLGLELAEQVSVKQTKAFQTICKDVVKCDKCSLRAECKAPVPTSIGEFNILIDGEAAGRDEDAAGRGFVGKAGQLLWRELGNRGYRREMGFVGNVAKCWPSKTKTPKTDHVRICGEAWHEQELQTIKPFIILAFGNSCNKFYRGEDTGIMELSGTTTWDEHYSCWICWSVHPAAVLRSPENRPLFEKGLDNFITKLGVLGFGL